MILIAKQSKYKELNKATYAQTLHFHSLIKNDISSTQQKSLTTKSKLVKLNN
jgi:hypothetical protein